MLIAVKFLRREMKKCNSQAKNCQRIGWITLVNVEIFSCKKVLTLIYALKNFNEEIINLPRAYLYDPLASALWPLR